MRVLFLDYLTAEADGRVIVYSKARNVEQQRGPTCAIHSLYNILMSQLSESGVRKGPSYADFERSVQEFLPKKFGKPVGISDGLNVLDVQKVAETVGLQTRHIQRLPKTQEEFESLLASGDGAAYVSIKFQESHGSGRTKSSFHAIFVTGKWVNAEGKTMYTVVDSNGQPTDTAFYTWEQLGPRLNEIVLLKPADVAGFQAKVQSFAKPRGPPPGSSGKLGTEPNPSDRAAYWKRVAEDREFAQKKFEQYRQLFVSLEELQRYARNQYEKSKVEAASVAAPAGNEQAPAEGQTKQPPSLKYEPSPKHEAGGWGTLNPFDAKTSQELLDSAIASEKKANSQALYNIKDKHIIVFRITLGGQYHGYELPAADVPNRLPSDVLKAFRDRGDISPSEYKKLLQGTAISP
jgi:hypothetical protein